ncbi:MAG: hypothetical protein ACYCT1_08640 [Steroidobacteraceae bacterium]
MVERTHVAFRLRPSGERKDWLMIHWYEQQGRHYLVARLLQDVEGEIGSGVAAHALPLHIEALEAWLRHDPAWSVTPEDWERLRDWCASKDIPPDAEAAKSLEPPARTEAPMRAPGPDELADAAQLARAGDTQAARDILREFAEAGDEDLIDMAREQVRLAEDGNVLAAKRVAEFSAQAIRGVLSGHLPASERRVYLEFTAAALENIIQGVDARKALGTWTNTRPNQVAPDREAVIILAVGLELEKLNQAKPPLPRPVEQAISSVARRLAIGRSAVERTWKQAGGEDAWNTARSDNTLK